MKFNIRRGEITFVLLCFSASLLFSQAGDSSSIVEMNREGVVSFVTYGEDKVEISKATGFVLGQDVMVTAYHIVSAIASAEGRNYEGKKVKIEGILSVDRNFDIAIVKIKGKLIPLSLGKSEELAAGKKVIALGSNESGEVIFSEGEVRNFLNLSATERVITTSLAVPETFCGGPLLDMNGKVMGMIIFLDRGSKFILPSNILMKLSRQEKATKFKDWKYEDYFSTLEGSSLAGRVFALLDETGKARRFLEKATELNPQDVVAHALLSSVYTKERNYQAAISSFNKVIELDETRDSAYYGLGIAYLTTKRYQEAISSLEKAVELNRDNKEAYYHIGIAYEELKNFAKAAEAYDKYVVSSPENPWMGYLRLGLSQMELEEYEKAIETFHKALEMEPQDIKTNYNLAQAYQKAGQYDKAEEAYNKLAEINPDDATVYFKTILMMYDQAGLHDQAIEAARKLIQLDPNNEINTFNLGIMYMKLERYNEAIQTFQDVLAINPNYESSYYNIGFCYSKQKKYQESIGAFKKFVELAPDNADGWFNIGVGYMLQKNFSAALVPLQKAVELSPDNGLAHYNLAITYLNLRDNYSAREVYEKLLTIDPDLAEKLKKLLR